MVVNMKMASRTFAVSLLLFLCSPFAVNAQQKTASLEDLNFIVGKWVGEGTSEAGAGTGYFTFEYSLGNKALIRRNHAEYPSVGGRPAAIHDDLMIVYLHASSKQLRAFYTDSEGNTIQYIVSLSNDGKILVFLSEPGNSGPRYRLTYVLTEPNRITLTFEVASADKPDQFRKIVDGKVRKASGTSQ